MDQPGHVFIATRAAALLAEDPESAGLADLLCRHLNQAAVGAWLPDQKCFKLGSGDTQNHVLKMKPYSGPDAARFVQDRRTTLRRLGKQREVTKLLSSDALTDDYWSTPFKGVCTRGEHPANCAMAISTTVTDLLLLGDRELQKALPKTIAGKLDFPQEAATGAAQASLYLFMLSHYVADANMPCHADARALASYTGKLHKEWEKYISAQVKDFPNPDQVGTIKPAELMRLAKKAYPLEFTTPLPKLSSDVWEEVIWMCRGAFALNCVVAPLDRYPADGKKSPGFAELFADDDGNALLTDATHAILHDAVYGVALIWKHIATKLV